MDRPVAPGEQQRSLSDPIGALRDVLSTVAIGPSRPSHRPGSQWARCVVAVTDRNRHRAYVPGRRLETRRAKGAVMTTADTATRLRTLPKNLIAGAAAGVVAGIPLGVIMQVRDADPKMMPGV